MSRSQRPLGAFVLVSLSIAALFVSALCHAQEGAPPSNVSTVPGKIHGTIIAQHNHKGVVGALVEIVERRQIARTDSQGRFAFSDLPPGVYHLAISAEGYASTALVVTVGGAGPDLDAQADAALDLQFHDKPVLVTASPTPKDPLQVYQPTSTLGTTELDKRAESSLGMTLQNEPGITTTNLGTAPARPVIRGLGGDRVLILEDGTRVSDVSSLSPDHAVAVDPSSAQSVEIVRGAANLLYGSNATAGVINVINGEIPTKRLDRPTGSVTVSGSSNASEASGTADVAGSAGPISYSAGGSARDGDEFHFNGGVAGNSQYDFEGYHAGLSWVGAAGYLGASFRDYQGNWGIPVSDAGFLLSEGEKGVTLDLSQQSYKLAGEITRPFSVFTGARLQAVRREYTHTEFEDTGEAGTTFNLDTTEVRADITHRKVWRFTGTFGAWLLDGDFSAIGDEAIVPQAKTRADAGFFYEEMEVPGAKILFGGRYDAQSVDPGSTGPRRRFDSWTGAIGTIVNPSGTISGAVNLTRNFKAPSAEELYANGPHAATFQFEQGNAQLDAETSYGYDVSLRLNSKRVSGELSAFRTDFSDFIFLEPTTMIDPTSGLPIGIYTQADALFQGMELHADVELIEHLTLELTGDQVRATNAETDEPLPQIPPYRIGAGLNWQRDRYSVGGETRYVGPQHRIASVETPTDGYTIYDVFGQISLPSGRIVNRITLRGVNLTNRFYRNHVSLTKDLVPQPGRNVRLAYTLLF